jgi:hypothetical protein
MLRYSALKNKGDAHEAHFVKNALWTWHGGSAVSSHCADPWYSTSKPFRNSLSRQIQHWRACCKLLLPPLRDPSFSAPNMLMNAAMLYDQHGLCHCCAADWKKQPERLFECGGGPRVYTGGDGAPPAFPSSPTKHLLIVWWCPLAGLCHSECGEWGLPVAVLAGF